MAKGNKLLKPISLESIGSDNDPCFGKNYDLTTEECKLCGDSELCCIRFAANQGKTRKQLEKENDYKDLEKLFDEKAIKKTLRTLTRKEDSKRDILDKLQAKYGLSREQARYYYRKQKQDNK